FCESRPQSLIGEYFLDCSPGHSGHVLKSGSTIPVTHTFSTIPADLLNDLTHNADTLITALANNSGTIEHFINESNTIATETNTQQSNLKATFHDLPPFLEQLKPSLAKLSGTLDANYPVLQNLNSSAGEIDRLLVDLPPFSRSALP